VNKFREDLSRVIGGAFSSLEDVKSEIGERIERKLKKSMSKMDLIEREEFDNLKQQFNTLLKENKLIKKQLKSLINKIDN